ncbi:MAG: hypothetical protein IKZ88_03535 [Neisseriaceae bacterium]|nr:hypothetical protein [Neisseriaceae bacterium]
MSKKDKISAIIFITIALVIVGVVGFFGYNYFSKLYAESSEIRDWDGWAAFKQDYLEDNQVDMKKYPYLYDKGFRGVAVKTQIADGTSTTCFVISTHEDALKTDGVYSTITHCDDGTMSMSKQANQ